MRSSNAILLMNHQPRMKHGFLITSCCVIGQVSNLSRSELTIGCTARFNELLEVSEIGAIELRENRQADPTGGLVFSLPHRRKDSFGVFPNLFGSLEIQVVQSLVVIFAIVGAVLAADLRTVVVVPTTMVGL